MYLIKERHRYRGAQEVADVKELETEEITKNSLNSLSPYIGKMRLSLSKYLIERYSDDDGIIYDPFAGSGTTLLEGWALGHPVVGNDLNYYAFVLSMGKLNPYRTLEEAESKLLYYKRLAEARSKKHTTDNVPDWVSVFFNEKTLSEILSWVYYLKRNKEWFLLANLLGILHHQRPGFLSFPSSHGAPYLRNKKYPEELFPEMYQYKNVYEKLLNKVRRSFKCIPNLDFSIQRRMYNKDACRIRYNGEHFSTIITSPPYMKSLTYARDNRLRLWFLGEENWKGLDKIISPERRVFLDMMKKSFCNWAKCQRKGDKCVLVVGDIMIAEGKKSMKMADCLVDLSKKYYTCNEMFRDPIPEIKKVVKGNSRIKQEIIIVLERA